MIATNRFLRNSIQAFIMFLYNSETPSNHVTSHTKAREKSRDRNPYRFTWLARWAFAAMVNFSALFARFNHS